MKICRRVHVLATFNVEAITTTHYNGYDFQQAQPIFKLIPSLAIAIEHICLTAYFTVYSHGYNISQYQQHPKDQTQAPARELCGPILQNQLQCHQIRGHGYGIIEPIIPGQREPKGIVNEPTVALSTGCAY